MNTLLFIIQILLFFLFYLLFKKKNISLCEWIEKINNKLFLVIIFLLSSVLPFLYIYDGHNWGGDFSCYIAQAQSIISGTMQEQVDANTFLVTNSAYMLGPGSYPWGFPLLLVPMIKIFGVNYIALKSVNIIFFAASIVVFYYILKSKLSLAHARIGIFFLILNPYFLRNCDLVLSDIPFLFFSIISVYLIDKLYKSEENQLLYGILSGISCFCAYFVRTNGIVSFLTLLSLDLLLLLLKIKPFRKIKNKFGITKQKFTTHLLAYSGFVLGVILDKLIFPSGGTSYEYYFSYLSAQSLYSNLRTYAISLLDFFSIDTNYLLPFIFVLALLLIFGIIKKELFQEPVAIIYIIGMLSLVVIFPANQGIRYLFPVLPWLVFLCLKSLHDFEFNILGKKRLRNLYIPLKTSLIFIIFVAVALQIGAYAKNAFSNYESADTNRAYTTCAIEVYDYIKKNTDEDDLLSFFKPRVLWLNTHRKGFSIAQNNIERIDDVDYVLLAKGYENTALKELCETNYNNCIVFENNEFTLYYLNKK